MKINQIIFFITLLFSHTTMAQLNGLWDASLDINGKPLQFKIRFENDKKAQIECGGEIIKLDEISVKNDSIFINLPVFDTEFKLKNEGNKLSGTWINNYRKTLKAISFTAEKAKELKVKKAENSIAGRWKVVFSPNTANSYDAIGIFEQNNNKLTGTFLTATGDYRFLEGEINGNEFSLSAFDGSHAFLFSGVIEKDSLKATFYSGIHYSEPFVAVRDEKFELPDAEKLTFLKDGYDKIDFSFPNLEGEMVSLEDVKFKNKVLVVQIMGSWCPNCMDETKFMADYYKKNKTKGIEFVALSFEKPTEFEKAAANVKRLVNRYNAEYTFLIAGTSSKVEASEKLPMLNAVLAFPTTIFIDKNGKVRKIHTGFNGPATGKLYDKFTEEFDRFILKLVAE
jgi:peroxiredoxin